MTNSQNEKPLYLVHYPKLIIKALNHQILVFIPSMLLPPMKFEVKIELVSILDGTSYWY